jgi:hypothetical protein
MDKNQFWLNLVVNDIVDLMENVFARKEKFSIEIEYEITNHCLKIKTCFTILSSFSL